TSLGKSIARVLGRKFVRIALGGVRDEAEIRGHRRTYIGAMPGRIIEAMKKAGTKNPVILLDEVDKLGRHFMGDPAAALLEVLDPEQNHTFTDHYIAAPFDLSQVLFICTANARDEIPLPLLDRMEVIELSGYTQEEKIAIAENHLIPEQIAEHGLRPEQITFTREALAEIIRHHTREAGVRDLKRKIAKVCRCVAREIIEKSVERITVDPARIHTYLGAPRYFSEVAERTAVPGVATGLAWTPVGGDILFVEVTLMEGKGNFTLTGQLGDVMKESAQAAYSYIRTHAQKLGIPLEYFTKRDLHIHVPAGATPKDGPSAGVTMLTAMVSAFTGRRVRDDVAMTGEITLRGLVLPVGGIKEKVLAAHRAGIKEVILPEQNAKDLADLPREVKESMKFHLVKRMHEVLRIALDLDFEEAQLPLLPPVDSQATQMPTNSLC
ncbi:MAG: endopeptidase La, partial [Deltaproteobacteria bacterium]